jgi:hypothetical protein
VSTEAATVTATPSAPPPGAISADPNAFTPEELAMLDGGEPAPVAKPVAKPVATQDDQQPAGDDDGAEAEIEVGADGQVRDLKTGRFVRHEAFLRTKQQAKSETERANRLAEEVVRSRERLAIYAELSQPGAERQQQEPAKPIDPSEDVFGALQQLMEENKALKAQFEKASSETAAQFENRALNEYVVSDATRFAATKPDFQKALSHALAVQDRIETRMGNTDPAARSKAVNDALRAIVTQSKRAGTSWAETVYNIAMDYGYKPAEAESVSAEASAGIDRIRNGQAAAVSMRHAGSGVPAESMTVTKLAEMSEREYLKVRADYNAKHGPTAFEDFTAGKRSW